MEGALLSIFWIEILVVSSSGINSLEINDNLVNFLDFRKEKNGSFRLFM